MSDGDDDAAHVTVRMPRHVVRGLDELASELDTTRSELIREYAKEGVVEGVDGLPDHVAHQLRRDQIRQKNRHAYHRAFFLPNFVASMREAFGKGVSPQDFRELCQGWIDEARSYDDAEAKIAYIRDQMDEYEQKMNHGQYDPLDDPLADFGGVQATDEYHDWLDKISDQMNIRSVDHQKSAQYVKDENIAPPSHDVDDILADARDRNASNEEDRDGGSVL